MSLKQTLTALVLVLSLSTAIPSFSQAHPTPNERNSSTPNSRGRWVFQLQYRFWPGTKDERH